MPASPPGDSPVPHRNPWLRSVGLACLLAGFGHPHPAGAQELEPRAYSPNPAGMNFLVLSTNFSSGDVLFDPTLPFTNVEANLNSYVLAYGHTFGLLGHLASVTVALPYARGDASGDVGDAQQEVHRSGLADPQLRLTWNLIGNAAMSPKEFARRTPETTVGLSLTIVPPLGQYDASKLVNIGANRWALRPQIGVSYPAGHWYLEGYVGVWVFTDNPDYYGGVRREEDPIGTLQSHVSYTFRPRLWLAFDATYYAGGRSMLNGTENNDRQSNTRVGLTLSVPAGRQQSLKFSWSRGANVRIGGDFTTYGVAWQYAWFD